jgi:hypothetical protein
MAGTNRLFSNNEIAPKDRDQIIAIDVETGEWAIGKDEMEAYDRLVSRFPHAQTWLARAGSRFLNTFGGRLRLAPNDWHCSFS